MKTEMFTEAVVWLMQNMLSFVSGHKASMFYNPQLSSIDCRRGLPTFFFWFSWELIIACK